MLRSTDRSVDDALSSNVDSSLESPGESADGVGSMRCKMYGSAASMFVTLGVIAVGASARCVVSPYLYCL